MSPIRPTLQYCEEGLEHNSSSAKVAILILKEPAFYWSLIILSYPLVRNSFMSIPVLQGALKPRGMSE